MSENTTQAEAENPKGKSLQAVHLRAVQRINRSIKDDAEQLRLAQADLAFAAGDQWDARAKARREGEHKPCLVLDLTAEKIAQVVGDMRQNKTNSKVEPIDNDADPDTAEVFNDHIRAIRRNSDHDMIRENAGESAVICGRGAWRILTEYEHPDSFDQVIKMEWVQDVATVGWDPNAKQYDKQDGKYMFVYMDINRVDYDEEYPGRIGESLEGPAEYPTDLLKDWTSTEKVRMAEYFEAEEREYDIVMLEDGRVVPLDKITPKEQVMVKRKENGELYQRKTSERIIKWYKIDGKGVLGKPKVFPSQYFPILFVWGKEMAINGKRVISGMERRAMDGQRMFNYWESKATEVVALAPEAPWLGTPTMFSGHEDDYDAAAEGRTVTRIHFNHDESRPNDKPKREAPPSIPTGIERRSEMNQEIIKATMGVYNTSTGAQSNEVSGKAITARDSQSSRGTYLYLDNLARTERTECKILLDMIPRVYGASRTVRVLSNNGQWRNISYGPRVDGVDQSSVPPEERIYDPLVGKYDVSVDVGPSYASQRSEARELLAQVLQGGTPVERAILLPRFVKLIGMPDFDEIAEELELLIPPDIYARLMALRNKAKSGLVLDGAPSSVPATPQILGPDGLPIAPQMPGAEGAMPVPAETQQPDPAANAKAMAETAKAMAAIVKSIKEAKEAGATDEMIDEIGLKLEGAV